MASQTVVMPGLKFHRRQILGGPLLLSVGVRYGAAETKQHTQQQRYLTLHLVMVARGTHDVGSLQAKVWLCPRAGLEVISCGYPSP